MARASECLHAALHMIFSCWSRANVQCTLGSVAALWYCQLMLACSVWCGHSGHGKLVIYTPHLGHQPWLAAVVACNKLSSHLLLCHVEGVVKFIQHSHSMAALPFCRSHHRWSSTLSKCWQLPKAAGGVLVCSTMWMLAVSRTVTI